MGSMRKALLYIFLCYLVGFLICATFGFLATRPDGLLPAYLLSWQVNETLIGFFDNFLVIHVSALLIVFSLFMQDAQGRARGGSAAGFLKAARPALVLVLCLSAAFALFSEVLLPSAYASQRSMSSASAQYAAAYKEARELQAVKEWKAAEEAAALCLRIVPGDRSATELKQAIETGAARASLDLAAPAPKEAAAGARDEGKSAADFAAMARKYYADEDYYSANYYAEIALVLDPARDDARRYAALSWQRISEIELSAKDEASRALYRAKMEAYSAFKAKDWLDALARFSAILGGRPADPDAKRYYALSLEEVKKISFYADDARAAEGLPGDEDFFFANPGTEGVLEVVYARKAVAAGNTMWFYGLEAMAVERATGKLLYHLSSEYGKYKSNGILLVAIERKGMASFLKPRYIAGSRPEAVRNFISLGLPMERIPSVAKLQSSGPAGGGRLLAGPRALSLPELLDIQDKTELYGFEGEPVRLELFRRFLTMSSFLILSILALGLGWKFRLRKLEKLPWHNLLFVPLFPLVVSYAVGALLYLQMLLSLFAVASLGTGFAVAAFVAAQGGLLALVIAYLAGQRGD